MSRHPFQFNAILKLKYLGKNHANFLNIFFTLFLFPFPKSRPNLKALDI